MPAKRKLVPDPAELDKEILKKQIRDKDFKDKMKKHGKVPNR